MQEELDTVIVQFDEDTHIGRLTLDRPEALNTLSPKLMDNLRDGLMLLDAQNDGVDGVALRTVILEGAGDRAFCAGADVTSFGEQSPAGKSARDHYRFLREFPTPIIAKIQGYCLGGGLETAMSCDFRIAAVDAELGLPEIDLGINPGAGGVQFLAEAINASIAKEVAMLGRDGYLSGEEAAVYGLVNSAHEEATLDEATTEFARQLAEKPPLAIQAIKRSANVAVETSLEAGIRYDKQQLPSLFTTQDAQEGMRAFAADDYEPEFEGK